MSNPTGIYRGAVYDLTDPAKRGRARLLVPAVYGNAVSGWANPVFSGSQVAVGDPTWVMFENGDINRPAWLATVPEGATHTHDDRYYTETEIALILLGFTTDAELAAVVSTLNTHTHDTRYYTETEVDAKIAAVMAQAVVRVVHGSVASTARPAGVTYVEWMGSVVPTNATPNDTWVNTTP